MDYKTSEQIDSWTKKLAYYKSKETDLRQRISNIESQRDSVNMMPVGTPKAYRFYKQLDSLCRQLVTLQVKIMRCKENITTLKREFKWS